jgi:hypothetical protein
MVLLPVSTGPCTFSLDGRGMEAAFRVSLAADEDPYPEENLAELEEGVDKKCEASTAKPYTGSGIRDDEGEDEWHHNKE